MLRSRTIPVLAADPDFGRFLQPEERLLAERVTIPRCEVSAGAADLSSTITSSGAFAGLVLEGMLLQTVQLGHHTGLRLLGPGDFVPIQQPLSTALIADAGLRATIRTGLAIFGDDFLMAARHWPRLVMGLHDRMSEQSERLLVQLMICQLPRVEERLLAMLWLVAETWGRVTPTGTIVPVRLTHGVLGGLIGARRSTVTLALKELSGRGAIVRQADGWLLLEQPTCASKLVEDAARAAPRPLTAQSFNWGTNGLSARSPLSDETAHAELGRTVERLRSQHQHSSERVEARLHALAQARERVSASRERITLERESR